MVSHETIPNSTQWILYNCDAISCDLSNWFAELLFGVIIGLGIFSWQIFSQRQRGAIFYFQVFDIMFPIFFESSQIILKIQERQEKQKKEGEEVPDSMLTKEELESTLPFIDKLDKDLARLEEILNSASLSFSKKEQRRIQEVTKYIQFMKSVFTPDMITIFNFKELLRHSMYACNTRQMLKKEIKKKKEYAELIVRSYSSNLKDESKEKNGYEEYMISQYETELQLIQKTLVLTNNLKEVDYIL